MFINKCYHSDGTEMEKDFRLKSTDKLAEELLDFLAKTTAYSQKSEKEINEIA